jgi:FdhD protein
MGQESLTRRDEVDEAPVWIAVNGVRRVVLVCSPADPHALALGHLLTEGWIDAAMAVVRAEVRTGPGRCVGVDVDVDPAALMRADQLRRHQLANGCGLRHFLDCEPLQGPGLFAAGDRPVGGGAAHDMTTLFRALFAAADEAAPAGGVHAAALTDGRDLVHTAVDVARHCAIDRVIGTAMRAGTPLGSHGLVATSRISGAMALKAVRAGVPWVASRSLATTLARELASAAGLPIHEQAARREQRTDPA